jgi:outer membrane protein OmpA-like peptidoglycan-associated protein
MVSGMLTALQDFARDAISGAEGENLETVRLGDFTVVLAYGPELILAGFVRGVAPRGLNRLFQDELDSIQEEQSAASVDFSGDTSKFESSRPHLEKCLVGQGDPRAKAPASSLAARLLLFGIPALLIAVALGWWLVSLRAERRWQSLLEQLGSQPGIVITTSGEHGGKRFISGLRDPLAADPAAMVSAAGLSSSQVDFRWEPYHSLHPRFAAERQYSAVKEQLERSAIRFSLGSAAIPTEAVVDELASQVTVLFNAAATTGREVKIEILGSTDFRGRSELNVNLARDRAATVEAALAGLGVPRERMEARGLTSPCGLARGRDDAACRTATLRVLEVSR